MVGEEWRLAEDIPTVMDNCGNTNHVMEVVEVMDVRSQPNKNESLGDEKKNTEAKKLVFASKLTTLTQMAQANRAWARKKLFHPLSLFMTADILLMTLWMIVDMVLDWLSCYKFYQMCQVTVY